MGWPVLGGRFDGQNSAERVDLDRPLAAGLELEERGFRFGTVGKRPVAGNEGYGVGFRLLAETLGSREGRPRPGGVEAVPFGGQRFDHRPVLDEVRTAIFIDLVDAILNDFAVSASLVDGVRSAADFG